MPPDARVGRVVAVVAHHEHVIRRDDRAREVAAARARAPGSSRASCRPRVSSHSSQSCVVGQARAPRGGVAVVAGRAGRARAGTGLPVDVELLLAHLDDVARQADDALDVVGAVVVRELEDDDVAPLRLGVLQDLGVR